MNIVTGRGRNRKVIEIPTGSEVAKLAADEPQHYFPALRAVCEIVKVPVPQWLTDRC